MSASAVAPTVSGRTWRFADPNLNTDLMMPGHSLRLPIDEQAALMFESVRPGWAATVHDGDILIGGRNFGTGSSRPVAGVMRHLGLVALVAESINELFFRNCINHGLWAIECAGVTDAVADGDVLEIAPHAGTV